LGNKIQLSTVCLLHVSACSLRDNALGVRKGRSIVDSYGCLQMMSICCLMTTTVLRRTLNCRCKMLLARS